MFFYDSFIQMLKEHPQKFSGILIPFFRLEPDQIPSDIHHGHRRRKNQFQFSENSVLNNII